MKTRILDNLAPLLATGLLVLLYVVGVIGINGFGGWNTFRAVLLLSTFLGIAAVGQTLIVLLGGVDLSIPFVIGAANVFVAKLYGEGVPFWLAIVYALALAAVFGIVNALIISSSGVHPLLVTLGSGTALLGAVQWWTGGLPTGGVPDAMKSFVSISATTGPIPLAPVVFLWALIIALVLLLTRKTVFGRKLYALGTAPKAARLALVNKTAIWCGAFAVSAVLAAVAGILLAGFTGSAFAGVGEEYLFLTIGAVVVGGTLVTGGRGGYLGTVIGAITLTLLVTVLVGFKVDDSVQQIVMGIVIIVMVAIYGRDQDVSERI
jgi:ribose transport system permease protein